METIIITNDTSTQKELVETRERGVEHTQQQAQEGIITSLLHNLVLYVSVENEGHTKSYIEMQIVIPTND